MLATDPVKQSHQAQAAGHCVQGEADRGIAAGRKVLGTDQRRNQHRGGEESFRADAGEGGA